MKKLIVFLIATVVPLFAFSCANEAEEPTTAVYAEETTDYNEFLLSLKNAIETEETTEAIYEDLSVSVFVTPSGEKYHHEWCRHIKNRKTVLELALSEAIESGYKACKTCY